MSYVNPNPDPLHSQQFALTLEYEIPIDKIKLQAIIDELKDFWKDKGKNTSFQLILSFLPPRNREEYQAQLVNLKGLFQKLTSYKLFESNPLVEFTSIPFDEMQEEDKDDYADYRIFLSNPKTIKKSAYLEMSYGESFPYGNAKIPAITGKIRNPQTLEKAYNENKLGGSFVTVDFASLRIPLASLICVTFYKYK